MTDCLTDQPADRHSGLKSRVYAIKIFKEGRRKLIHVDNDEEYDDSKRGLGSKTMIIL